MEFSLFRLHWILKLYICHLLILPFYAAPTNKLKIVNTKLNFTVKIETINLKTTEKIKTKLPLVDYYGQVSFSKQTKPNFKRPQKLILLFCKTIYTQLIPNVIQNSTNIMSSMYVFIPCKTLKYYGSIERPKS